MKEIEDVLLYLHTSDETNMFDLEQNIKIFFVSEVLRSEMNRRIKKQVLKYCEDAILELTELTVKLNYMIVFEKTWYLIRNQKIV